MTEGMPPAPPAAPPAPPAAPAPGARPQGITILAVLAAIGGVLGVLGSIALIGIGGAVGTNVGGMAMLLGLVALVLSVMELAFAYGAWTLKPWGWMLGIVVAVISLVSSLINVVSGGSITSQVISIAIAIVILYYLNTPNVKAAFGRR